MQGAGLLWCSVKSLLFVGSHGSGLADETLTPLVAWGSGVAHSEVNVSPGKMLISKAESVLQADVTPFMSSLLGLSIPVNSVVSSQCIDVCMYIICMYDISTYMQLYV